MDIMNSFIDVQKKIKLDDKKNLTKGYLGIYNGVKITVILIFSGIYLFRD